ncbi:MAG: hypothetical protein GF334_00930 [Candidatus Altiarchaeales archaeon]|nr:hypothetical protein [Candidatus Altiarchaeales archaeon]
MSSEIFNLNSLPTNDTVSRGARVGQKNARTTKTVSVGPEDNVKTGEQNVNADYLVESSLIGNDLKGYGTFTPESPVVTGYTGPVDLNNGDVIRASGDTTFYTVTGLDGTNLYVASKYQGETSVSGVCTIRKTKLDSAKYIRAKGVGSSTVVVYDKNKNEWSVTGSEGVTGPFVAPTGETGLDTGMSIEFLPGASQAQPDLMTVDTVYKTLVKNNSNEITDLGLSPIPYPHETLKVYWGSTDGTLEEKTEFIPGSGSFAGDYIVNYSQNPTLQWPRPPLSERQVAYIKFLGDLEDEVQVEAIDATFQGGFPVTKASEEADAPNVSVRDIIPDSDSVKVGGTALTRNSEYLINTAAGIVNLITHQYQEELVDTVSYPKRLMWDGVSVIRGVGKNDLTNPDTVNNENLVISGVTGLQGITGVVYFEDTDDNNLIRETDYSLEYTSGAIRLTQPIQEDEAVLVSYYVEGEDEEKEKVASNYLRTSRYPVLRDSVVMTKRQDTTQSAGVTVMIEGQDFDISYLTGWITIYDTDLLSEEDFQVEVSYTPMSPINCILQQNPNDDTFYRMTIVDDHLKIVGDPSTFVYEVENPIASVLQTDYFKKPTDPDRYSYNGSLADSDFLYIRNGTDPLKTLDTAGYTYEDDKRQITLDVAVNDNIPTDTDDILATYNVVSDVLPYAPLQPIFPVISEGGNSIVIEGFDRTDLLKPNKLLRIDNFDPVATYYFRIKSVVYANGNTTVTFYGTFPEDIRIPTFYTFDDFVSWEEIPEATEVNRSALKGSTSLQFRGVTLEFLELVRTDGLLLVNGTDVYTVTSVEQSGTEATVNIFPKLLGPVTGDVYASDLPVVAEGEATLQPMHHVIDDPEQPAFTIWYQPPTDAQGTVLFEGSANILITEDSLVLYESIEGISNPSPYVYTLSSYGSIRALVDAIKATKSTFAQHVDVLPNVPEYYPFTTLPSHVAEELYFLPNGAWSSTLIIPFEEGALQQAPYTVTIAPELKRRTILEAVKDSSSFDVPEIDRTSLFGSGDFLYFLDQIEGTRYFFEVVSSNLVPTDNPEDTRVFLSDTFRENLLDPRLFRGTGVSWQNVEDQMLSVDYTNSTVTFSGTSTSIASGILLKFSDMYVYNVDEVTQGTADYTLKLAPAISSNVTVQNFEGYVQRTAQGIAWTELSNLNETRLVQDSDYGIVTGGITLTRPVQRLERFRLSYMGIDTHAEDEGKAVTCTCKYFTSLSANSQVDVYLDYLNIDQFYLQKLTEERFLEIVTVPQMEQILQQKGGSGGQSADTGATDDSIPAYEGGLADKYYRLRDEKIKMQLYLRIYKWYKARLRSFASELQLTMGFQLGNSNSVGTRNGHYTLQDAYVENGDYTLTTDSDIQQIQNGFSKFFPVGYEGTAPLYYDRFSNEYRTYNEVFCYNLNYYDESGNFLRSEGRAKSVNPYWVQNLDYTILNNTSDNLVAYYEREIPSDDRTFSADDTAYSWLRRISTGDTFEIEGYKDSHTIGSFSSGTDKVSQKPYDAIVLAENTTFSEKGIRSFNITVRSGVPYYVTDEGSVTLSDLEAALSGEGYNIIVKRQQVEPFPMYDDEFSYGRKLEGGAVDGHVRDKDRIKKFSLAALLTILFGVPAVKRHKYVTVQVGRYDENSLAFTTVENISVDLSELNFFQERKVSTTEDALYENYRDEPNDSLKGFDKYFYLSFEKIYDEKERRGYREGFVLRTKDRNLWFRFVLGGSTQVADEYGFTTSEVYKNFYYPDNMYRYLLLEKQAWEIEEMIIRDIYDYNDKIARAFNEGQINLAYISKFKGYLAQYIDGEPAGISEWIASRISKYAPHLAFFLGAYTSDGDAGPLNGILKPDGLHDEDSASAAIAQTFKDTTDAKEDYTNFYAKYQTFSGLNHINNQDWKYDYIRWVLSLEEGLMYQKDARVLYDESGQIKMGLRELQALRFRKSPNTTYTFSNTSYTVTSTALSITTTVGFGGSESSTLTYSYNLLSKGQYKTLDTLVGEINSQKLRGVNIFQAEVLFDHYPYGSQTTENLLQGTWSANLSTWATSLLTNVADHRVADPRILFLNKFLEDSVPLDHVRLEDREGTLSGVTGMAPSENPLGVWPIYTSNGNPNKEPIEGLPVAGEWETLEDNVFDVIQIRSIGAPWTLSFSDMEDGDFKDYMGPPSILKKIDDEGAISSVELSQLRSSVVSNQPQVTILKKLVLTRRGVQDTVVEYNLRQYSTINKLVEAINATRFNKDGIVDPEGDRQYFEARLVGDKDLQGEVNSYELMAEYEQIRKSFRVYSNEYEQVTRYSFTPSAGPVISNNPLTNVFDLETDINSSVIRGTDDTQLYSADLIQNGSTLKLQPTQGYFPTGASDSVTLEIDGSVVGATGALESIELSVPNPGSLTGDYQIQESTYEIPETQDELILSSKIRYFSDSLAKTSGASSQLNDYVVGWQLAEDPNETGGSVTLRAPRNRYSLYSTHNFNIEGPEAAYQTTLSSFPLGLRKDILAFDIYCWDDKNPSGERYYEVRDNWIYFVSANVKNHGIPLAGSGHPNAPYNESLADLLRRINTDQIVNKYFYANLKFTRESKRDPGYFEYTYLPNFKKDVPKSTLDTLYLRQDAALTLRDTEDATYRINPNGAFDPSNTATTYTSSSLDIRSEVRVISVSPGNGYTFSASSFVVNDGADTLSLSATWKYNYSYTKTFLFSDASTDSISELVNAINAETVPVDGTQLFDAVLLNDDDSDELLATSGNLNTSYVTLTKTGSVNALKIKMNTTGGAGYTVLSPTYSIRTQRDRLILRCTIQYNGTYNPPAYNISSGKYTLLSLTESISNLKPVSDPIFTGIFDAKVFNLEYALDDASELLDVNTSITGTVYAKFLATHSYDLIGYSLSSVAALINEDTVESGVTATYVSAYGTYEAGYLRPQPTYTAIPTAVTVDMDLREVRGVRLLNMDNPGIITVEELQLIINSYENYRVDLPDLSTSLSDWVDSVKGDTQTGMLSVTVLPMSVESSPYGLIDEISAQSLSTNEPAHVYFGVMGDIRFVQISDYNLYTQINYIKERLAKPWKNSEGKVVPDYYTPEQYNTNNPYAIDDENFLNWLRSTRYGQIRNSVINEATVANMYFWLYLKFHKEFGCDQQKKLLEDQIERDENDQKIIGQAT